MPERFELGTLPYELLAGTRTAVDVLAALDADVTGSRRERLSASLAALHRHEETLRALIDLGLADLDGITVHSKAAERTPPCC